MWETDRGYSVLQFRGLMFGVISVFCSLHTLRSRYYPVVLLECVALGVNAKIGKQPRKELTKEYTYTNQEAYALCLKKTLFFLAYTKDNTTWLELGHWQCLVAVSDITIILSFVFQWRGGNLHPLLMTLYEYIILHLCSLGWFRAVQLLRHTSHLVRRPSQKWLRLWFGMLNLSWHHRLYLRHNDARRWSWLMMSILYHSHMNDHAISQHLSNATSLMMRWKQIGKSL